MVLCDAVVRLGMSVRSRVFQVLPEINERYYPLYDMEVQSVTIISLVCIPIKTDIRL